MKRPHVIIAVDSEYYKWSIIKRLQDLYSEYFYKTHIIVGGPEIDAVMKGIAKKRVASVCTVPTPIFNYSYSVNLMVREYVAQKKIDLDDTIVLVDSWLVVSLPQCEPQVRECDFNKQFLEIPVYRTSHNESIWTSKRLYTTFSPIIKNIEQNPSKATYGPPVLMLRVDKFLQTMHGLEENLFTPYSRIHLSQQLQRAGLKKEEGVFKGLCFIKQRFGPKDERDIELRDSERIEELSKNHDQGQFIPNNIGVEFGSAKRLPQLKVENGDSFWSSGVGDTILKVRDVPDKVLAHGVELTSEIHRLELSDTKKFIAPNTELNGDVLIMVDNTTENVICTTPLIKALYFQYANVDILTNRKLFEPIKLLTNMMVRSVYEASDLQKGSLNLSKYEKIIRTHNCGIKLASKDITTVDCNEEATLFATNLHPKGTKFSVAEYPPYCSWTPTRIQVPCNCVLFLSSMNTKTYRQLDNEYLERFNILLEKLMKRKLEIMVLNLSDEMNHVLTAKYKKNARNFHYADKVGLNDCAMLITNSSFVICSPYTDAYWLTQGLNTRTLVYTDNIDVKSKQHSTHHYFFNYKEKDVEDYITGLLLKYF
jgi:hypothetical protein